MFNYHDPRLHILTAAAGLDQDVCHRLLNGQRRQVALEFGFSEQEVEYITNIKAETLQDLAQGLLAQMAQRPAS